MLQIDLGIYQQHLLGMSSIRNNVLATLRSSSACSHLGTHCIFGQLASCGETNCCAAPPNAWLEFEATADLTHACWLDGGTHRCRESV